LLDHDYHYYWLYNFLRMPPPSDHTSLHLRWLKGDFFVAQLRPSEPIPESWITLMTTPNLGSTRRQLFSITVTPEETSIVGEAEYQLEGKESTWKCIQIAGPMDFGKDSFVVIDEGKVYAF
jgi:hypothetical protein